MFDHVNLRKYNCNLLFNKLTWIIHLVFSFNMCCCLNFARKEHSATLTKGTKIQTHIYLFNITKLLYFKSDIFSDLIFFTDLTTHILSQQLKWNNNFNWLLSWLKLEATNENTSFIIFVWSQYVGGNIEQRTIRYGCQQNQEAKLKIVIKSS